VKWQKGQSGNPTGAKPSPWAEALRLCAQEVDVSGRKRLRELAEKVFEMAIAGDMEAVKEIGNRLDGKPRQEVVAEVNSNVTVTDYSWIEHLPAEQLHSLATIAVIAARESAASSADSRGASTVN